MGFQMKVMVAHFVSSLLDASLQPLAIHFQNSEDHPRAASTLHLYRINQRFHKKVINWQSSVIEACCVSEHKQQETVYHQHNHSMYNLYHI
jgi:hypothetical protein